MSGRVRMPHNNRMASSSALRTNDMWSKTIGYDPYKSQEDNKVDESSNVEQTAGLMLLARMSNISGSESRGGCKKCGMLGHLTFQCRNAAAPTNAQGDESSSDSSSSSGDDGDSDAEERVQENHGTKRRRSPSPSPVKDSGRGGSKSHVELERAATIRSSVATASHDKRNPGNDVLKHRREDESDEESADRGEHHHKKKKKEEKKERRHSKHHKKDSKKHKKDKKHKKEKKHSR